MSRRNVDASENKQRRLFKKKRAGIVLTRDEVREIKKGRKKLRREMKARGIRNKAEFELTAGNLGLYFDKRRRGCLFWLMSHWLAALIGALLVFLAVLFIFSLVQHMRGHFAIHLSDGMFKEGFTLSDNVEFTNPTIQLFANPAQGVPCISINQLPTDIDEIDGEHNDQYFAYTYYIRNEGENTVDFDWTLDLTSETQNVSEAVWVMLFCDGEMRFFAKANRESGEREAIPSFDDNGRGYTNIPIMELAPDSDQFGIVKQDGQITYRRIIPDKFESPLRVTHGSRSEVDPMEVHKFTVVMWLEGDDIDTNDSVIGGHLGIEMNFKLASETDEELEAGGTAADGSFRARWKSFRNSIRSNLTSR